MDKIATRIAMVLITLLNASLFTVILFQAERIVSLKGDLFIAEGHAKIYAKHMEHYRTKAAVLECKLAGGESCEEKVEASYRRILKQLESIQKEFIK